MAPGYPPPLDPSVPDPLGGSARLNRDGSIHYTDFYNGYRTSWDVNFQGDVDPNSVHSVVQTDQGDVSFPGEITLG